MQYPNEQDPQSQWPSGLPSQPQAPPNYGQAPGSYRDEKRPQVPAIATSDSPYAPSPGPVSSSKKDKGPPPMWSRPPPRELPYTPFQPMCLVSHKNDIGKGFPEEAPPCTQSPHPFATHDITEEDWKRFLADVKKAGGLTMGQHLKAGLLPGFLHMTIIGGIILNKVIESRMRKGNRTVAGDMVDAWNEQFFGPRRMEVVLCQAEERLSGREGAAPVGDPRQEQLAHGLRRDSSSSSADQEPGKVEPKSKQPYTLYVTAI